MQLYAFCWKIARHSFSEIDDGAPSLAIFNAEKGPHQPYPVASPAFRLIGHFSLSCSRGGICTHNIEVARLLFRQAFSDIVYRR
jgi:hypothetical protein